MITAPVNERECGPPGLSTSSATSSTKETTLTQSEFRPYSDLFDLRGQVAVVTGSSLGIGRAIAERLAEHGSKVVFSSRTLETCQRQADAVNERWGEERAIAVRCDASVRADLRRLVETTLERWDHIDTVVGNALVSSDTSPWIERFDEDSFTPGSRAT